MSGPVDVLAVLDEAADWLHRSSEGRDDDQRAANVKQVRAAIAELIEAAIEFRAGIAALVICQEQDAPQDIYDAVAEKFTAASHRQAAALAATGETK